jgi:hypothetical protein
MVASQHSFIPTVSEFVILSVPIQRSLPCRIFDDGITSEVKIARRRIGQA